MKIDLSGKKAIVTGSTTGIGLAAARGLLAEGAAVVVNGRGQAGVDKTVAALRAEFPGASVRGVAADLGAAEGCGLLVEAEPQADILVNNTGVFAMQDFFEIPDSEWDRFLDVNLMSAMRLARAYLPGMEQRGWGRVIFISSEAAVNVAPEMIHYSCSKAAMLALSRGLAKRMAGTGITVNAVLPGPTNTQGVAAMITGIAAQMGKSVEDAAAEIIKQTRPSSIIGRLASVEEVASMVVYLASPQAAATTGAALRVDGGTIDTIA